MKKLVLNVLVLLILIGCNNDVIFNKEKEYFTLNNGILYYKGSPFNGTFIKYLRKVFFRVFVSDN